MLEVVSDQVYAVLLDIERFQSLTYALGGGEVDESLLEFSGRSLGEEWRSVAIVAERKESPIPSFWDLDGVAAFVISDENRILLRDVLGEDREFLPLDWRHNSEVMWLVNVTDVRDCLQEGSLLKSPLRLQPNFDVDLLPPDSGLFKIPQTADTQIFYVERGTSSSSDSLRTVIERLGLTGLRLHKVWSSVEGPRPVNLVTLF